ncbi:hypothetical protein KXR53_09230 [Inquilinus limosus]|uniref:hypothetical protein n=1 Tax=Inquilinus limosus TaxID=171674 RepID=UPI003F192B24
MSRLSARLLKTGAALIAASALAGCVVYPTYPHPVYYARPAVVYHPYYHYW